MFIYFLPPGPTSSSCTMQKMNSDKNNTINVLSTNDMRKRAQGWTLAGDVGLLAHLEQFSEEIYNKTQQTQKFFNELTDEYDEVCMKIGNITNQFLALQNCQFVENRVYDEETPTEEKVEPEVKDEVEQEKLLWMHYKEAVEVGVKLLDTHFQEVQLPPNSDSDDDEPSNSNNSLIWRPKNPYANKKFPLLIGSAEWWADDNVGLREYEENLDTDLVMSESESEFESLQDIDKKIQMSSSSSVENERYIPKKPTDLGSSSEDLFGLAKSNSFNDGIPKIIMSKATSFVTEPENYFPPNVKSSLQEDQNTSFNETLNETLLDNVSQEETTTKSFTKLDSDFTRELAARLGSVTAKKEGISKTRMENEAIEKPRDLSKSEEKHFYSESLFDDSDENDGNSDLFSGKIKSFPSVGNKEKKAVLFDAENDDQLFTESNDLFFGTDTRDINGTHKVKKPRSLSGGLTRKSKEVQSVVTPVKSSPLPVKSLVNDLFDNIDDDDTLFGSNLSSNNKFSKKVPLTEDDYYKKSEISSPSENKKSKGLFDFISDFESSLQEDDSSLFSTEVSDDFDFAAEISVNPPSTINSSPFQQIPNKLSKFNNDSASHEKLIFENPDNVKRSSIEAEKNAVPESKQKLTFNPISNMSLPTKKSIFLDTTESGDDLFWKDSIENSPFDKKITTASKIFHSVEDDDNALFLDKPRLQDSVSISSSRSSLFDEPTLSVSKLSSVFDKDKNNKLEDDLFGTSDCGLFGAEKLPKLYESDLFSSSNQNIKRNDKSSLFDDWDDNDDLFGPVKRKEDVFPKESVSEKLKNQKKFIDLFQESNNFLENTLDDSIFEQPGKSVKAKSLFKSESLKEDLFAKFVSDSSNKKSAEKIRKSEKVTEETEEAGLFGEVLGKASSNINVKEDKKDKKDTIGGEKSETKIDVKDDAGLFTTGKTEEEEIIKPKPPSSLGIRKDVEIKEAVVANVGKLNIPVGLKSKLESIAKHKTPERIDEKKTSEISAETLDETIEPPTNLLKCPSKGRVKIPVRRRPQSRRARQEAIRNSVSNFEDFAVGTSFAENPESKPNKSTNCADESQSTFEEPGKPFPEHLVSSPVLSNPLSPSTDEEDYFNVPELDTNFEEEDQSIFKSDLFQVSSNSKVDDSLLFDGAPVLSPPSKKQEEGYLVKTENVQREPESLFETPQTEEKSENLHKIKPKTKKVRIFGADDNYDSDDEDRLFKAGTTKKKESVQIKKSGILKIRQVEKKESFFDTLSDDGDDLFADKGNICALKVDVSSRKIEKKVDQSFQSTQKDNASFKDSLRLISKNK